MEAPIFIVLVLFNSKNKTDQYKKATSNTRSFFIFAFIEKSA